MPRLSIGRLMVLVAIVAVDCWVARNLLGPEAFTSSFGFENGILDLAIVPMATILAVGLVVVRRDRARRPGFIGFEATGWAVLLVYVGFCVMDPDRMSSVTVQTFWTFCEPLYFDLGRGITQIDSLSRYERWYANVLAILLAIPTFTLPQLLVALGGGLLARWFAKGVGCRP